MLPVPHSWLPQPTNIRCALLTSKQAGSYCIDLCKAHNLKQVPSSKFLELVLATFGLSAFCFTAAAAKINHLDWKR